MHEILEDSVMNVTIKVTNEGEIDWRRERVPLMPTQGEYYTAMLPDGTIVDVLIECDDPLRATVRAIARESSGTRIIPDSESGRVFIEAIKMSSGRTCKCFPAITINGVALPRPAPQRIVSALLSGTMDGEVRWTKAGENSYTTIMSDSMKIELTRSGTTHPLWIISIGSATWMLPPGDSACEELVKCITAKDTMIVA